MSKNSLNVEFTNPDRFQFIFMYLDFIPQFVKFNHKRTNHGPHDPKKEQNKGPQNDQKCDFGHRVSASSRPKLKFNRYRLNRVSKQVFRRHKQFIAVKFIDYKI